MILVISFFSVPDLKNKTNKQKKQQENRSKKQKQTKMDICNTLFILSNL